LGVSGAEIFTVIADTVPFGTVPVDVLDVELVVPRSESSALAGVSAGSAADGAGAADDGPSVLLVDAVPPVDEGLLELASLELLDALSVPVSATATAAPPISAAATPSVTTPAPRDIRTQRARAPGVHTDSSFTNERPRHTRIP